MKSTKFKGKVKEINEEHMCFKQRNGFIDIFHSGAGFTGHIKEIFDIEGRLLEYEDKDSDEYLKLFESNNYDINGNLLLQKSIDEGNNKIIKQNIYNFNNKLIQTIFNNSEGLLLYTTDYFYNNNNKLEKCITKYKDSINTEHFKYDSNDRILESILYENDLNNNFKIIKKIEYEYSENEVIIKEYFSQFDDQLLINDISIFDSKDRIIEHKYFIDSLRDYSKNEKFHYTEKFHYDNELNLLIQKICLNDNEKLEITSYYYEAENLIEERLCNNYSNNIFDFEQTKYKYKYDDRGNWIEKYTFYDKSKLNSSSLCDGSYSRRNII